MRNVLLAFSLMFSIAACGGSKAPPPEPPVTETAPPPKATCDTFTECGACVTGGCSWSGSSCADTCLQDVACYGAGNPAAPTCPDGTEPPAPETF